MVQDIREAIAKFTTSKNFRNDTFSRCFLKLALPRLEHSMAMLFNTSIETSIFPNLWKLPGLLPFTKKVIKVKVKLSLNIGSASEFKALQKTCV